MISFICSMVEDPDDQSFLIDIYQNFKQLMLLTARKYISDPFVCEDIVHDSVVKLIRHVAVLRDRERSTMAAYIISTVRTTAIDYLRKQDRDSKYWFHIEDEQESVEPAPGVEDLFLLKEQHTQLYDIWPKLSESDQIALAGKYILGYTDEELAELLDCQKSSVRSKLSRARKRALSLLSSQGKGEAAK